MRYYDQTIFADPARGDGHDANGVPGDCWRACIASLLGVEDYFSVPHFALNERTWYQDTFLWVFEQTGKQLLHYRDIQYVPEGIEIMIGGGPSPRGNFHHVVIVDRESNVLHDPHPSRAGLVSVDYFFGLV